MPLIEKALVEKMIVLLNRFGRTRHRTRTEVEMSDFNFSKELSGKTMTRPLSASVGSFGEVVELAGADTRVT